MRIEMLKYSLDQSSTDVHSWHILDERTEEQVQVRDGMMTAAPCPGVTLAPWSRPRRPQWPVVSTPSEPGHCSRSRSVLEEGSLQHTTLGTIFSLDQINIHSIQWVETGLLSSCEMWILIRELVETLITAIFSRIKTFISNYRRI